MPWGKQPANEKAYPDYRLRTALLLTSCWHLGDRHRNAVNTYTGVDIFHPVDGKIHHAAESDKYGAPYGYVIAPEISYKILGPVIHWPWDKPNPDWAEYRRPTGRVVIARIGSGGFCEIVSELPKGLPATEAPKVEVYDRRKKYSPHIVAHWRGNSTPLVSEVGRLSEQKGEPSSVCNLLATSCDYAIDPLLDVVSVPVCTALAVVGLPLGAVAYWTVVNPMQQQQANEPTEDTLSHGVGREIGE